MNLIQEFNLRKSDLHALSYIQTYKGSFVQTGHVKYNCYHNRTDLTEKGLKRLIRAGLVDKQHDLVKWTGKYLDTKN